MATNDKARDNLLLIALLVALVLAFAPSKGCDLPTIDWSWLQPVAIKPLVVLLYEGKHGSLPDHAFGAASDLASEGYDVRMVDDDVVDGEGKVPAWLAPGLEQGRAILGGQSDNQQTGHALLLLRGGKLSVAVKLPSTREEIVKFVKEH
jgi:hypothetical protein